MNRHFVEELLFGDVDVFQSKAQAFVDANIDGTLAQAHVMEALIQAGEILLERYNEQALVSFEHVNPDLLYKAEICATLTMEHGYNRDQKQRAKELRFRAIEQIDVVEASLMDFEVPPAELLFRGKLIPRF